MPNKGQKNNTYVKLLESTKILFTSKLLISNASSSSWGLVTFSMSYYVKEMFFVGFDSFSRVAVFENLATYTSMHCRAYQVYWVFFSCGSFLGRCLHPGATTLSKVVVYAITEITNYNRHATTAFGYNLVRVCCRISRVTRIVRLTWWTKSFGLSCTHNKPLRLCASATST